MFQIPTSKHNKFASLYTTMNFSVGCCPRMCTQPYKFGQ
uniref:Uncharacterized protein n=1 Tax=Arundo donax TaxID=35708 RepID=A0A0A9CCJ1_ARUDO